MFFVMIISFISLVNLMAVFMVNHKDNIESFKLKNVKDKINKN